MAGASRTLTHALLINPSYPSILNDRGKLDVPEIRVGAATLPLLATLTRALRCTASSAPRRRSESGPPRSRTRG